MVRRQLDLPLPRGTRAGSTESGAALFILQQPEIAPSPAPPALPVQCQHQQSCCKQPGLRHQSSFIAKCAAPRACPRLPSLPLPSPELLQGAPGPVGLLWVSTLLFWPRDGWLVYQESPVKSEMCSVGDSLPRSSRSDGTFP